MEFGFMNAILLHSDHRHVFLLLPPWRWPQEQLKH